MSLIRMTGLPCRGIDVEHAIAHLSAPPIPCAVPSSGCALAADGRAATVRSPLSVGGDRWEGGPSSVPVRGGVPGE